MKNLFLKRVMWMVIPLLTMFNSSTLASNTTRTSDPAPAGTYTAMISGEAVVAGDTIIVVYERGNRAMSTTQNTNNRGYIAVTISNTTPKTISLNGTTTVQALAVAASANSGWTLYTGEGYLYAPNYNFGTNNYLKTETTNKDGSGGNWTISYNSMVAAGSGTRRYLLYNTNNNIFSCYASNAQNTAAITVYKKAHSVTYKANGGSTTCSDATLYKSNATVTVCNTTPTRDGFNFTGWTANVDLVNASTSANITAGTSIAGGTTVKMPSKHVVFTAQWESTAPVSPEKTVYLKPNGIWNKDGARFAIYYWKSSDGEDNGWLDMSTYCGPNFTVTIPEGYDKFQFCRMDGAKATNNWDNKWNRTPDLDKPTTNDVYTIEYMDGDAYHNSTGSWGTYTCPNPTTIYLNPNSIWDADGARYAAYYWEGDDSHWVDFEAACGAVTAVIPSGYTNIILCRMNGATATNNWSNCWTQTTDQVTTGHNNYVFTISSINGCTDGKSCGAWTVYSVPTYTISYAKGTVPTGGGSISGSRDDESKTCGTAFTLPSSAVFTTTGYTQTGWATEDGGTKVYDLGDSYTTNAARTFYPFWTVNSHTLTWDFDGGSSSETAGTDYTAGGSVNYGTTIDYPSNVSMSKTGYTFTGWSSSPATMPDDNLTITAQWSVQSYTITWSVNNQTWTNGVTDANNHANHGATVNAPAGDGNVPTGAAMPCGTYTFMGWSAAITPTSEDGGTAPADLFTTTSPAITQETTFYAVFAETSGSGDAELTTAEITAAYCSGAPAAGCGAQTSYANGPYTISSDDGDWYGVCAINNGNFTLRLAEASQSLGRPYMLSPDYGASVSSISINATHAANSTKYIYICASATGDPANNNIGSIVVPKNNTEALVIEPSSSTQQFYMYVNDAVTFTGITVSYGSYSNYKTYCDNTKAYVNYNAAGGTTSCEREAVTKGANYTICSSTPTKTGYTFQGWLSDEATPQTYQPNATISNVQNDIVLTAQWTATTYTITYNGVKTGATNTNPTSYTVEDLPINLVAATHDQWRFDGWTDDNAGNVDITTIPVGTTGNQSFTAHWTQRYAVTWYEESTPTIEYYDPGATLQFPADPSAPASCSEKKFVGWMVGTIEGETDDKPTFVTAGEVNADAAYHAVWANAAGSAIAAVEDNTFTQSDVSRATYCGISNGLQSVGKYVQNQSIWNSTQMTGVNVKIKVYHVSNSVADVLRISLINSSGEEVVGTDLTTSKLGNGSSSAGYSSNVTLTPTTAVTGYKVSLKTKNSSGTAVGKVTREVVPAYSKYSTSCCDNNVAAPSVTATATRNSITLSWTNVTDATGYKVTINGATHNVTTAACTYTESGLTSGTDYAWTVIATYDPANYCGAIPTKGTTATLSVYGVTYNKNTSIGSGTVTMSPMPSDASTYVVGENVTAAAKPTTSCTNAGYSFNGWNTEPDGTGMHVDAEGTIAMVEGGLTLYAEWVAKRAYYVDRMHGQGDQTIEIGGKTYHCYYGDGYHTTPSPSDQKSGDACQTPHYRFVRWLTRTHINDDGTQKDTGGAVGGGVQRGTVTDGETYYAIWEEEIEE